MVTVAEEAVMAEAVFGDIDEALFSKQPDSAFLGVSSTLIVPARNSFFSLN